MMTAMLCGWPYQHDANASRVKDKISMTNETQALRAQFEKLLSDSGRATKEHALIAARHIFGLKGGEL